MSITSTESPIYSSAPGWPLVLYFHHVTSGLDHYTNISPDAFRYGLDLVLSCFIPVSYENLTDADGSFTVPDEPAVLLTFDDGYSDLLDAAVPALAERGVKALFFLCTSLLGQRSADPQDSYLSWAEARDLAGAGHSIGSHGRTHRPLTQLPPDSARHEVAGSLGDLKARLGIERPVYAYPYGKVSPLPGPIEGFSGQLTAFGTVKSPSAPWSRYRTAIRRTYLPTGDEDNWEGLVARWRENWKAAQ